MNINYKKYRSELYDDEFKKLNKDQLKERYLILRNSTFKTYRNYKELLKLINYLNRNNINIFDE